MAFTSFFDFIQMDGHGFYVWMAFIVAISLFKLLFFKPFMTQKKILQEISRSSIIQSTQKSRVHK